MVRRGGAASARRNQPAPKFILYQATANAPAFTNTPSAPASAVFLKTVVHVTHKLYKWVGRRESACLPLNLVAAWVLKTYQLLGRSWYLTARATCLKWHAILPTFLP